MGTLSHIAELGKQGMLYTKASIGTTGKNITNVNTDGYSRQRLDVNPTVPETLAGISLISAIKGDTLRRIREDFVDEQFWDQNSLFSQYGTEKSLLRQLEGVLPASSESSLHNMLDEFWRSWNTLSNDPESTVARTGVRDIAEILTLTFNRVHRGFQTFQESIGEDIKARVKDINIIGAQLAELNKLNPGNNFELEDQRIRLIDRLSELSNVEVQRNGGSISVSIGGLILVSGTAFYEISVNQTHDDQGIGQMSLEVGASGRSLNVHSGEIGAMLEVYNHDLPLALQRIDILAVNLAQEVNIIHRQGYNLNDVTGLNFFDGSTVNASNIKLNAAIVEDPYLIATSDTAGEPGNSEIAKAITDMGDTELINDQTLGDYYLSLVGTLGNRVQEATFLHDSQNMVVTHLEMRRKSISGVSIDEEMTKMVLLEQAFVASSRLVAMADELTKSILELV